MSREQFIKPYVVHGRRGYTGLQIASSPTLRAFIAAHPELFERGPANLDIIYIREPIPTDWVEGLDPPTMRTDEDGLPVIDFRPRITVGGGRPSLSDLTEDKQ